MEPINWEFLAAQAAQLGALLVAIHKAVVRLEARISSIETKVEALWDKFMTSRR